MITKVKKYLHATHPIRLFWHRIKAWLAALWYFHPSKKMIVIGITGTNGKTTTVSLTAKFLEKAGYKVGMASTINFKIDRKEWQNKSHKTTLGPFQLQKLLREMLQAGCQYAVIETSSHALSQHRVAGVHYDIVAITNVTPEHLDYHKSMKAYRQDKMKLFAELSKKYRKKEVSKISVHHMDDHENREEFMKFKSDKKIGYSKMPPKDERLISAVWCENIEYLPDQTRFTLCTPEQKLSMTSHLPGEFNIENILAAAAICHSQGVTLQTIADVLTEVRLIPGRLEPIEEGQKFKVYIDFAMTEDGYRKLLSTLRQLTPGKLWVVFGCCGDRDRKKRPRIGEICAALADRVVVCDDEPYTEDPAVIREMILEGLRNSPMKENHDFFEIPDREKAITYAFQNAAEGDTIVIPGLGDFEGRTFADGIHPWNEREEARKILRTLSPSQRAPSP